MKHQTSDISHQLSEGEEGGEIKGETNGILVGRDHDAVLGDSKFLCSAKLFLDRKDGRSVRLYLLRLFEICLHHLEIILPDEIFVQIKDSLLKIRRGIASDHISREVITDGIAFDIL